MEDSSAVTGVMIQPLWQFATGMTPSVYGVPGILSAAALVFFPRSSDSTWWATASEETKNLHKNVPLGIGVGMLLIIYHVRARGRGDHRHGLHADLAKQDSPRWPPPSELVGADGPPRSSASASCWAATVVMVLLLGLTRIVFAMSRDGLLPRGLSKTASMAPRPLCRSSSARWWRSWPPSFDIGVLSDMANIGTLSAFTLVAISIPIMRRSALDLPRAFKIPGSLWIPILIAVANFWLMLNLSVPTDSVSWCELVVGFAIYFGCSCWRARLGKAT